MQPQVVRTIALTALAIVAANARGSIVYQDVPNIHFQTGSVQELSGSFDAQLDLNGDGVDDVRLELGWDRRSQAFWTDAAPLGGGGLVYRGSSNVNGSDNLVSGFSIGEQLLQPPEYPAVSRQWSTIGSDLSRSVEGSHNGWWGGAAHLGVRIAVADGTRYGWVSMSASSNTLDIYSFAYETEVNTPIGAGAVPAPGAGLMAAGSLIGVGLRRARRP